jgi:hypothetical protein
LEGFRLENVDKVYAHREYLTGLWDFLRPLLTFCVHLVHFSRFWYHAPIKIWQPCPPQSYLKKIENCIERSPPGSTNNNWHNPAINNSHQQSTYVQSFYPGQKNQLSAKNEAKKAEHKFI